MRDPLPEELKTREFNAVWDCIKHWDVGLHREYFEKYLKSNFLTL
jgi:hypothetical protein